MVVELGCGGHNSLVVEGQVSTKASLGGLELREHYKDNEKCSLLFKFQLYHQDIGQNGGEISWGK